MALGAFLDGIRRVTASWRLLLVLLLAASGPALFVALATGSPAHEVGTADDDASLDTPEQLVAGERDEIHAGRDHFAGRRFMRQAEPF